MQREQKQIRPTQGGFIYKGKNPTALHNSYFILKLDFSCVDPTGSAGEVKKALFNHINGCIEDFYSFYTYKGYELPEIKINYDDALYSLKSLVSSVRITPYSVYLLIDEYDNFANTVMMGVQSRDSSYNALVHDQCPLVNIRVSNVNFAQCLIFVYLGLRSILMLCEQAKMGEDGVLAEYLRPLRTFFKAVKALTSGSMFDRVFITGVSPVVMSDITSGYNIAENVYFVPEFNDLCGFTQDEVTTMIKNIVDDCDFGEKKINRTEK